MGALHEGHASLMKKAKDKHEVVIVSIFVNPTQFNDASDFEKYPRTTEADLDLCKKEGIDIVYLPEVSDVYPDDIDTKLTIDLGGFDNVMEGEFRPGHFEGVCEVVKRLLDLTQAQYLYMGQKDFQQFMIIGRMIKVLNLKPKLVVCKTSRTSTGLARSSRNTRLSPEGIVKASTIHRTLVSLQKAILTKSASELQAYAMNRLSKAGFETEYIQIVDGSTLLPLEHESQASCIVVCAAAWLEGVRLIDNIIIRQGDLILI
jgi:pantoate--beta-alanine ligase